MDAINEYNLAAIQAVWGYNCLNHERTVPSDADVVVALGCRDVGVARRAAEVCREIAPNSLLVMTGKHGEYTKHLFGQTEAQIFANAAVEEGVQQDRIILEENATNTGENVCFTQELLKSMGLTAISSVVLVQKPFLERRALATFEAQWQGASSIHVTTTSENLDFKDYCTQKQVPPLDVARQVVGAMRRVIEYPEMGYQTRQEVPGTVYQAYCRLVEERYGER